jgi:hypothetical protein
MAIFSIKTFIIALEAATGYYHSIENGALAFDQQIYFVKTHYTVLRIVMATVSFMVTSLHSLSRSPLLALLAFRNIVVVEDKVLKCMRRRSESHAYLPSVWHLSHLYSIVYIVYYKIE